MSYPSLVGYHDMVSDGSYISQFLYQSVFLMGVHYDM